MTTKLQRYKVWDLTTRLFHWINAVSVLSLIIVGVIILNTKLFGIEGEAKVLLKMIHASIGYVFVVNLLWRIIWAFFGGHHARWRQILPTGKNYLHSLKSYTANFFSGIRQQYLGHNPVARLIISLFFILLSMQAITGLVIAGTDLYYPPFGGYFAEWVTDGDPERLQQLRPGDKSQVLESAYAEMRSFRKPFITIHVYNFYLLSVLILIHIIGVIVTEVRERNGLISAMISGEKVLDDAYMDVGGTTPWTGEVEPRLEQRSRVESGTETEQTQDKQEQT
jgi:Ni/Fe-hydrogenase 1 B-type cytochrome subunit